MCASIFEERISELEERSLENTVWNTEKRGSIIYKRTSKILETVKTLNIYNWLFKIKRENAIKAIF